MGVIIFDDVPSSLYGIEVSSPPRYSVPEEDVDFKHIAGRSGDFINRWKSFKNITVEYSISFLKTAPYMLGDVNMDGSITVADSSKLGRYIVGLENGFSDLQRLLADFNKDGLINDSDTQGILEYLAGMRSDVSVYEFTVTQLSSVISQWLHPYYTDDEISKYVSQYATSGIFKMSKDGYFRLMDDYDPLFYRKAVCKDAMEFINVYDEGAAGTIKFVCTPQKWYNSGEVWYSGENASETLGKRFDNPSKYPARPIIRISAPYSGTGVITIKNTFENPFDTNRIGYGAIGSLMITEGSDNLVLGMATKTVQFTSLEFADLSEFSTSSSYGKGDFCSHDNTIWRFLKNKPAGAWDETYVEAFYNIYIDFETGKAYTVARDGTISSYNDNINTKITYDTGTLTYRNNYVKVEITGSNSNVINPKFELLPRWWTI